MRPFRLLLCALAPLLAAALPAPAAAQVPVPPPVPTAGTLAAQVAALADTTARQWPPLLDAVGQFANPFPADLARGHGAFVPPMLVYAIQRTGLRAGDQALLRVADRAWPAVIDPERASAFDMIGAAYAFRGMPQSPGRRAQLAGYLSRYGIPTNGRRCLLRPRCYSNLKLVDALAVLAITGGGVAAADPAARLGNPAAARAAAVAVVNQRIPQVADHGVHALIGGGPIGGTVLSDPPEDPLAYHALSTFMLGEAVAQLGAGASPAALRVRREALDALSVLVAPDGDATYLGRGQAQVWVPALTAAALAAGARDEAVAHPKRAGRYLAGAQRAVARLAALHSGTQGLLLVPGAATRTTADGIDAYAHTIAYNGLALFGLNAALDALAPIAGVPIGPLAADGRLSVRDEHATGLGVLASGRVWLAVHKTATNPGDLRHDFGWLALKRRTATGWADLLAPRPLTVVTPDSGGPALDARRRGHPPDGLRAARPPRPDQRERGLRDPAARRPARAGRVAPHPARRADVRARGPARRPLPAARLDAGGHGRRVAPLAGRRRRPLAVRPPHHRAPPPGLPRRPGRATRRARGHPHRAALGPVRRPRHGLSGPPKRERPAGAGRSDDAPARGGAARSPGRSRRSGPWGPPPGRTRPWCPRRGS